MREVVLVWASAMVLAAGCQKGSGDKSAAESAEPANKAERAVTINLACGAVGKEFSTCKEAAQVWAATTGHRVGAVSTPASASEILALYQQLLAAKAPDIDVFRIDIIWPGILGDFFIDLGPHARGREKKHFAALVANNTRRGRLVAMPWFIDAGLLYYRKDLLAKYGEPVPTTWDQLTATAERIQKAERRAANPNLWGFVWQGRAYEGLTCVALEWIASYGGGTIVDAAGNVTIANPRAVRALERAASWVGSITPTGVLNYGEEQARGVFQSGNAVFMRNWPYAWALAQDKDSPVRGKVGVAPLPKGDSGPGGAGRARHAATLGGWQLAVSKYSKHPQIAADLVMYLTSPTEQKRRAIDEAHAPTVASVYQDPAVRAANPFFDQLYATFADAVARPSTATGVKYNRVSSEFWNAVHAVIGGRQKAERALADLQANLERIGRGGQWGRR